MLSNKQLDSDSDSISQPMHSISQPIATAPDPSVCYTRVLTGDLSSRRPAGIGEVLVGHSESSNCRGFQKMPYTVYLSWKRQKKEGMIPNELTSKLIEHPGRGESVQNSSGRRHVWLLGDSEAASGGVRNRPHARPTRHVPFATRSRKGDVNSQTRPVWDCQFGLPPQTDPFPQLGRQQSEHGRFQTRSSRETPLVCKDPTKRHPMKAQLIQPLHELFSIQLIWDVPGECARLHRHSNAAHSSLAGWAHAWAWVGSKQPCRSAAGCQFFHWDLCREPSVVLSQTTPNTPGHDTSPTCNPWNSHIAPPYTTPFKVLCYALWAWAPPALHIVRHLFLVASCY